MHKLSKYGTKYIGFRRWSHKAWAVFSSLSRVVRICTLKNSIADQSFLKQQGSRLFEIKDIDAIESLQLCVDDAISEIEDIRLQQEGIVLVSVNTNDCTRRLSRSNLGNIQPAYIISKR